MVRGIGLLGLGRGDKQEASFTGTGVGAGSRRERERWPRLALCHRYNLGSEPALRHAQGGWDVAPLLKIKL